MVHSFPVAAITNYHELSDLNQHEFINIIIKFWRAEVRNRFDRMKTKMLARLALLEALGKGLLPCLFHVLEATCL